MNLYEEIKKFKPLCSQEESDKAIMLGFILKNPNYLERENLVGHFSVSAWILNTTRSKVLMVYHNIYDSWAWVGGHADGIENLREVCLREIQEETGVQRAKFVNESIFSLEILTVNGHVRKGNYVPSHLHFNITYLVEADELEEIHSNPNENKDVKWFTIEEATIAPNEKWMTEHIYKKLIERSKLKW